MTDMIIRYVDGYGYLPIVVVDGKEVYRGEFCDFSLVALGKCEAWVMRNGVCYEQA